MKKKILPLFHDLILLLAGISFPVYFLLMQWSNRFSHEENYYFCIVRDQGFFQSQIYFYLHSGGRWVTSGILGFVYWCSSFLENPWRAFWVYFVFFLFGLIASVRLLLEEFFRFSSLGQIDRLRMWSMSGILSGAIYYGSFQVTDDWYWINSSFVHLLPVPFVIAGLALFLNKNKTPFQKILMFICVVVSGGCAENIALFLFLGLSVLVVSDITQHAFSLKKNSLAMKGIPLLLVLSVSFGISVFSPANRSRLNFEHAQLKSSEKGKNELITESIDGTRSLTELIFQNKNKIWIFLSFLGFIAFAGLSENPVRAEDQRKIFRFLLICCFLSMISTWLFMEIVFHSAGPLRCWLMVSICITSLIFVLSFFAGNYFRNSFRLSIWNESVYYILIVLFFLKQMHDHLPDVTKHSKAYDERVWVLKNLEKSGNKNTIEVEPLPAVFVLLPSEISTNAHHASNRKFADMIGISFPVKLRQAEFRE